MEISELGRRAGVTLQALRHYQRLGMLLQLVGRNGALLRGNVQLRSSTEKQRSALVCWCRSGRVE